MNGEWRLTEERKRYCNGSLIWRIAVQPFSNSAIRYAYTRTHSSASQNRRSTQRERLTNANVFVLVNATVVADRRCSVRKEYDTVRRIRNDCCVPSQQTVQLTLAHRVLLRSKHSHRSSAAAVAEDSSVFGQFCCCCCGCALRSSRRQRHGRVVTLVTEYRSSSSSSG